MTALKTTREIVVPFENKPEKLALVTRLLAGAGINVAGVSYAAQGPEATLHLLTTDPAKAEAMLQEKGFVHRTVDVLAVPLANQPGQLADVVERLAKAGVPVEHAYGAAGVTAQAAQGELVLRVKDLAKAQQVLGALPHGVAPPAGAPPAAKPGAAAPGASTPPPAPRPGPTPPR